MSLLVVMSFHGLHEPQLSCRLRSFSVPQKICFDFNFRKVNDNKMFIHRVKISSFPSVNLHNSCFNVSILFFNY